MAINKISTTMKEKIRKKTVMTLPDDPSKQGYSPDQIKRRMAAPIIDETESVVSEVNRIVDEVNEAITDMPSDGVKVYTSIEVADQSESEYGKYAFIATETITI